MNKPESFTYTNIPTQWSATVSNIDSNNYSDIFNDGWLQHKNISGDNIKIKDKSLSEVIESIEQRLAILHPNPELEERWEELKALRDQYHKLEQEILEKEKTWNTIKK